MWWWCIINAPPWPRRKLDRVQVCLDGVHEIVFHMTREVSATGLKLFNDVGDLFLGTGAITWVLLMTGDSGLKHRQFIIKIIDVKTLWVCIQFIGRVVVRFAIQRDVTLFGLHPQHSFHRPPCRVRATSIPPCPYITAWQALIPSWPASVAPSSLLKQMFLWSRVFLTDL